MRQLTLLLFTTFAITACGPKTTEPLEVVVDFGTADEGSAADMGTESADVREDIDLGPLGGERPAGVTLPIDWSPDKTYPVVVMLHGLGASSRIQNLFFQIGLLVDDRQFILVLPEGTVGPNGQFWNATSECCDLRNTGVDDSTYLIELGEEAVARYGGDPDRLYFMGHSNGGFMSYRLACDHSDKIAGIASVAGTGWLDASKCGEPDPVSVLQIHGTEDTDVPFEQAAQPIVDRWVERDGCDPEPVFIGYRNFDSRVSGEETRKERYDGCSNGTGVEFWTMTGSTHIPTVGQPFTNEILDFLFAHTLQ